MSCENVGQEDSVVLRERQVWKRSGGYSGEEMREQRELRGDKKSKEEKGRGCVNTRARKEGALSPHRDVCITSPFENPVSKAITVLKSHPINMRHSCAGCPPPSPILPQS